MLRVDSFCTWIYNFKFEENEQRETINRRFSLEKAAPTRKRLVGVRDARVRSDTDRGHETVLVRAGRSWLLAVSRWTIWYGASGEGYQSSLLLHRHFA